MVYLVMQLMAAAVVTASAAGQVCTYDVSPTTFTVLGGPATVFVDVTAPAGCGWTAVANDSFITIAAGSPATGSGPVAIALAAMREGVLRVGTVNVAGKTVSIQQYGCTAKTLCDNPTPHLEWTTLAFGAVSDGASFTAKSSPQTVRLWFGARYTPHWTASSSVPWLTVSPDSCDAYDCAATLSLSVRFVPGLVATQTGTITISPSTPGYEAAITVTLRVRNNGAAASGPFGSFDTPSGDATVLSGSVAVTGWTLDDVGVKRVELWRDVQPDEATPPFASTPTDPRNGKLFIATPTFVQGARPDIESAYANLPLRYRAGWGYLMLTWGLFAQGNGTYKLYAFAFDEEDNVTTIGTKTIVVNNGASTKPFGSIDNPAIGGIAGAGNNVGWALTPKVNGVATCQIRPGGVQASIDSGPLFGVTFGDPRSDIAAFFTGFANSAAAGAHFSYDWTTLSNGTHTIGWLVTDDCNRADGIGSRFFSIQNGSQLAESRASLAPSVQVQAAETGADGADPVTVAHGYGNLPVIVTPDSTGLRMVHLVQGDRIEMRLPRGYEQASQRVNGIQRALPVGATWDAANGIFYWQPAAAFLGSYELVFVHGSEQIRVRVFVDER